MVSAIGEEAFPLPLGDNDDDASKEHEEFVEDPQVNFLSVHAPVLSSPLTTTTVVIQDLDDEDDSRQASKTKGKDESTSTTASQGAVLSDLPTTCYHLKGTSAKSAQDDSLKSSLSLLAPRRKTRVRRHQLMTASRESRHGLLLLPLPTTFQQLLSKVAPCMIVTREQPCMIVTRVLSHLALTILRLLPPEEHAFYLFAVKVLATLVMDKPSTLKPCDREMVLVMERVHSSDLADELGFVRTFRYRNDTSIYVAAVIAHVRSVIDLRVPLPDGYSSHRAPAWNRIPQKGMAPVLFKMPSK